MLTFWILLLALEIVLGLLMLNSNFRAKLLNLNSKPAFQLSGAFLLRLGMAVMFLLACWGKLKSPYGFAELVAQYQFLPSFSVNFFSLWLPVLELLVAVGIVLTKWTKEMTAVLLFMFAMFIVALSQALVRDLGITCGCFDIEGAQDKSGAWISLLRDIVLLPPLIWLYRTADNRYIWNFKG